MCREARVKRWELYNLVADRTEMNDLAESHREKVSEIRRLAVVGREAMLQERGGVDRRNPEGSRSLRRFCRR